ncbi:MobF family relaxase [Tsukamurella ocularis]|uniref:MobF family relaxase n=1 Tax=Tsukamurella ocularis TaxID=1970234 RepID=UPI0021677D11|nr:MobF family relaxase [Tsukamurella ocularis]MCS3779371.1 conjugative relaxase-like TrwC/TraI family protein [Tsukamurella ocularis]MCS3789899.1 conjugative relaxase-like TrwC/TraI family protein [Tsukamurella ocularis]
MMTIHALHAGDGYTYLLKEVATEDQRLQAGQSLVDYYQVQGCPPGIWGGKAAEILGVSGEVREDQMRALFGEGLHPEADAMIAKWIDDHGQSPVQKETARQIVIAREELGRGLTEGEHADITRQAVVDVFTEEHGRPPASDDGGRELRKFLARQRGYDARSSNRIADDAIKHARLGRRFATFKNDVPLIVATRKALRDERVAKAGSLTEAERAKVKHKVAVDEFTREVGRAPANDAELTRFVAAQQSKVRQPVAGFDMVFTPPKSVSVLWGLGDDETRRAIEDAHHAATQEAMDWLENNGAFTRVGAGGVGQLDVKGIIYSKFDHRDNRNGDPNLHTHVTVSNRTPGADGKWRTLDSRTLHKLAVSMSERYNTHLPQQIRNRLAGVEFEPVVKRDGAQPVFEVAGIPAAVRDEFSRRPQIEERLRQLAVEYERDHGRKPSKSVQYQLAQQATLETRDSKPAPRSLGEMRAEWADRADTLLGGPKKTRELIERALGRDSSRRQEVTVDPATADPKEIAAKVVDRLADNKSVWNRWHVEAAVHRAIAAEVLPADATPEQIGEFSDRVTEAAMGEQLSVLLTPVENQTPDTLRRASGASIFTVEGAQMFTSARVIGTENRLIEATKTPVAYMSTDADFAAALALVREREGFEPSAEQQALARHFTHTGTLLAVGVGPAGTGKTTSMKLAAEVWQLGGGRVVALSHQGAAADILAAEISSPGRKIAGNTIKMLELGRVDVRAGDMLLVDEAGMASRDQLDGIVALAASKGAVVRLLGDPQQLPSIEAGGTLGLLAAATDAPSLREVRRFNNPEEGDITLRWRDGDTSVVSWYHANDRIITGRMDELPDLVYDRWRQVEADGKIGQMMAPTNELVTSLNARVLADRRTADDQPDRLRDRVRRLGRPDREATLRDGLTVREGDRITTRKTKYSFRLTGSREPVRNGHLYQVSRIHADGSMTVTRLDRKTREARRKPEKTTLPADYVKDFCEVGYASTVNAEQGDTVDVGLGIAQPGMNRQQAYVETTRGRDENLLFVPTDALIDVDQERPDPEMDPADALLKQIIANDGAPLSAAEQADLEKVKIRALDTTIPAYEYVKDRLDRQAMHATITRALDGTTDDPKGAAWELMNEPAWSSLQPKLDRAQRMAGGDANRRHELVTRLITETCIDPAQQRANTLAVARILAATNLAPTDGPAAAGGAGTQAGAMRALALQKLIAANIDPNPRGTMAGAESPAKVLHYRLSLLQAADRRKAAAWLQANREHLVEQLPELAYTATQAANVLAAGKAELAAHQQDAIDAVDVLSRQPVPGVAVAQLAEHTAPPEPIIERPEPEAPEPPDPELDLDLPPQEEPTARDDGALPPAPHTTDADFLAVACDDAERRRVAATAGRDPMLPTWVTDPGRAHWDGGDQELITWQKYQHDKIAARTQELADQIATRPPEWAKPYGPAPAEDTNERRTWDRTVGQIAAWREQHRLTHPRDALGAKPAGSEARGHWQTLSDQGRRLEQQAAERARRAEEQRRREQAARAEQARLEAERRRLEQQRAQQRPGPGAGPTPRGPRI